MEAMITPSVKGPEMGMQKGARLLRQAADDRARLRIASTILAHMNVCNLTQPLPDRLVGAACNASITEEFDGPRHHVSPDALMRSAAWRSAGKSDLYDIDWRTIGTMVRRTADRRIEYCEAQPFEMSSHSLLRTLATRSLFWAR